MTIASTTGWPPSELDRMTPGQVMRYAIATAEAEGKRLSRELQLYDLPVEAYGGNGKYPMHDALTDEALRLMGSDDTAAKQGAREQERRENEHIRKVLAAERAGDEDLVERLEYEWEQELRRRKAAGESQGAGSTWVGVRPPEGFVKINRHPAPEPAMVN